MIKKKILWKQKLNATKCYVYKFSCHMNLILQSLPVHAILFFNASFSICCSLQQLPLATSGLSGPQWLGVKTVSATVLHALSTTRLLKSKAFLGLLTLSSSPPGVSFSFEGLFWCCKRWVDSSSLLDWGKLMLVLCKVFWLVGVNVPSWRVASCLLGGVAPVSEFLLWRGAHLIPAERFSPPTLKSTFCLFSFFLFSFFLFLLGSFLSAVT